MDARWRAAAPSAQDRRVRRAVLATLAIVTIVIGPTACSENDAQGRQEPDLTELESQVAQLRLEVQNLREEVRTLREELASSAPSTVPGTGTTAAGGTTSTTAR
jgi:uncharacterized coiled-coil protein SlyX